MKHWLVYVLFITFTIQTSFVQAQTTQPSSDIVDTSKVKNTTITKSAWKCLPQETLLAIRLPNPYRFVETLKNNTQFGTVLLNEQRIEKIKNLIQEKNKKEWDKTVKKLERYNLSIDDWPQLFKGANGIALVVEPRPNHQEPLAILIGWIEPSGDLTQRLWNAIEQSLEEQQDNSKGVKRLDLELNGHHVMHLTRPEFGPDRIHDWKPPANADQMTPDELEAYWDEQERMAKEVQTVAIDRHNIFLSRLGNRLVVAATFLQSSDEVRKQLADDQPEIDWNDITGAEQAKTTFARFLMLHKKDESPFTQKILSTPGLRQTLPKGQSLFEIYVNAEQGLNLAKMYRDSNHQVAKTLDVFTTLGLDSLTCMSWWTGLEGNQLNMHQFIGAPVPRRGLLALLDQPALPAKPHTWVSSNVENYAHFSIDLGRMYDTIKESMIGQFGEQAAQGFQMAEMSVMQFTQADLSSILSSLGQSHTFLQFETSLVEMDVPDPNGQWDENTNQASTIKRKIPQSKVAYVWQVRDEALWKRMMQVIGAFTASNPESFTYSDEQGFVGWRFSQDAMGMEGGLFLGKGHLVLGMGKGATERVLAMLRHPPPDNASLLHSEIYTRTTKLIKLQPGLMFGISNMDLLVDSWKTILSRMSDLGLDQEYQQLFESLIPTEKETDGLFGVNISQGYTTKDGFVMQSLVELPPPASKE